jgi:hypothetical protein
MPTVDRRDFLKLSGIAGVTFTAGLFPGHKASAQAANDFHFVQISDTHWGYKGPANPDAEHTLEKAIVTVNGLANKPDFIVFTGDLTHTTEDGAERRARMKRFKEIVSALNVKDVRFLAGEHDASLDKGAAFKEFFGATNYTFDHKGVHFIALDNVSDPAAKLGDEQLAWLAADLKQRKTDDRIVVLDDRRRRQGDRSADAVHQRRGVLRPHPPGEPPHDRPHRPSCGEVADLPAAGPGQRAPPSAAARLRRHPGAPRHARHRDGCQGAGDHRDPGHQGLVP